MIRSYADLKGDEHNFDIRTIYANGRILFQTSDGIIYRVCVMTWDFEYDDEGNKISQTALFSTKTEVYVDVNGTKGPNLFGKDVFVFYIDFDSNQVYPLQGRPIVIPRSIQIVLRKKPVSIVRQKSCATVGKLKMITRGKKV